MSSRKSRVRAAVPAANVVAAVAAVAAAAALAGAPSARAAEGSLEVQAGDTVVGRLARCLDRQVAEIQLLQGQVFRLRLEPADADNDSIYLRVYDPTGLASEDTARLRQSGNDIVAGPFRVTVSGTWRFEVSTPTAHESEYRVTTRVRRTRAQTARIGGRRGTARLPVMAGTTFRVLGRDAPSLAVTRPGATTADVLAPGTPAFDALRGPGLVAAGAGTYAFTVTEGSGRARIRATPPRRTDGETVAFPALLEDSYSVASWQGVAGWVRDRSRTAPDEQGYIPPPLPMPPETSPFSGSIVDDCPAPGEATADGTFGDPAVFAGPRSGVGLPVAGIPRLDDVVRGGALEIAGTTPSYRMTRSSDALGDVETVVRFTVDGRPALAPLALDGRVRMSWSDAGGSRQLHGSWTVSFDPVSGVQVLDGGESYTPNGAQTVSTAASGFALLTTDGAWPQGTLFYGLTDVSQGLNFVRSEVFDGDAEVQVNVRLPDGSTSSFTHDFR